jgi:hypothetical protein
VLLEDAEGCLRIPAMPILHSEGHGNHDFASWRWRSLRSGASVVSQGYELVSARSGGIA